MRFSKIIIAGCLFGASFFVACQQNEKAVKDEQSNTQVKEEKSLKMKEASELALLMRDMYDQNLDLRERIIKGDIPKSFPEDFIKIHSAESAEDLNETFDALAKEYIANIEAITEAESKEEGIKAYNQMVSTCASCHTIYCQGPLAKIKKMRIKAPGGI